MKTLAELDNVEMAFYLHCWFPQHMPRLLVFLEDMAISMSEDDSQRQPDVPGIREDEILGLWREIANRIQKDHELAVDPERFAESLFGGKIGLVNVCSLVTYVGFIKHEDPKFTQGVNFLFGVSE